jgi:hypothetical protein
LNNYNADAQINVSRKRICNLKSDFKILCARVDFAYPYGAAWTLDLNLKVSIGIRTVSHVP